MREVAGSCGKRFPHNKTLINHWLIVDFWRLREMREVFAPQAQKSREHARLIRWVCQAACCSGMATNMLSMLNW